ncbi:hypothetical protein ACFQU7_18365 [Pseudoroseomonas wenyumeiae]
MGACALVVNLQTIVSRRISPAEAAVVSVTELLTDGTRNALPGLARILGDARSFRPEVSAEIEAELRRIAAGTAMAHGLKAEVTYTREFVPLVNDAAPTLAALEAARAALGAEWVRGDAEPISASEDFARFLEAAPGCFASSAMARLQRRCTTRVTISTTPPFRMACASSPPWRASGCRWPRGGNRPPVPEAGWLRAAQPLRITATSRIAPVAIVAASL